MRRFKTFIGLIILLLGLNSCQEEDFTQIHSNEDFIVDFQKAKVIAQKHFTRNAIQSRTSIDPNWGESITFNGANDLPGLHVFNYVENSESSFVIIAGDNRVPPILAYGESSFPLDTVPFGVAD